MKSRLDSSGSSSLRRRRRAAGPAAGPAPRPATSDSRSGLPLVARRSRPTQQPHRGARSTDQAAARLVQLPGADLDDGDALAGPRAAAERESGAPCRRRGRPRCAAGPAAGARRGSKRGRSSSRSASSSSSSPRSSKNSRRCPRRRPRPGACACGSHLIQSHSRRRRPGEVTTAISRSSGECSVANWATVARALTVDRVGLAGRPSHGRRPAATRRRAGPSKLPCAARKTLHGALRSAAPARPWGRSPGRPAGWPAAAGPSPIRTARSPLSVGRRSHTRLPSAATAHSWSGSRDADRAGCVALRCAVLRTSLRTCSR